MSLRKLAPTEHDGVSEYEIVAHVGDVLGRDLEIVQEITAHLNHLRGVVARHFGADIVIHYIPVQRAVSRCTEDRTS